MKAYKIVLLLSAVLLSACYQPKNTMESKQNYMGNSHINSQKYSLFYISSDDIKSPKLSLKELIMNGELIVHNGCLSIKSPMLNHIHTLVIPKSNNILLNDDKEIIGIINTKSNKKLLIGDKVSLSGVNSVKSYFSEKPVPKECSQTLLFTGEVF